MASGHGTGGPGARAALAQAPDCWPLLGREAALGRSAHVLANGHPTRGLVFAGPRGCGHTRLLQEIGRRAAAAGLRTVHLPAARIGSPLPLSPFMPLLGPDVAPSSVADLQCALVSYFRQPAGHRATVILVDGVDHLDDASLALLYQVAAHRLCYVVGASQAPMGGSPAAPILTKPTFIWEEVPPLSREDTAQLIASALGHSCPGVVVDELALASRGLPRFAASLLEGSIASGDLRRLRGKWILAGTLVPDRADRNEVAAAVASVGSGAAALVRVVHEVGGVPEALVRTTHEAELVAAEQRGLLQVSGDLVVVPEWIAACGVGEARGPLRRTANGLKARLARCDLARADRIRLAASLDMVAGDEPDPDLLLAGARAALLTGRAAQAVRLARAAAPPAPLPADAMRSFAEAVRRGSARGGIDTITRALQATDGEQKDLLAHVVAAASDRGWLGSGEWLPHLDRPALLGARAELLLEAGRFDDAERMVTGVAGGGPERMATVGIVRAVALAVAAEPAACLSLVGDVYAQDSAHTASVRLPSPTMALNLGTACGVASYLLGLPPDRHPGDGWWTIVDAAAAAVSHLLAGRVEGARVGLGRLGELLPTPDHAVLRHLHALAGCLAGSPSSPREPDADQSWWARRAAYMAADIVGDRGGAIVQAHAVAAAGTPPAYLMITLHDLVRLRDVDGARLLVRFAEAHEPLVSTSPVAETMTADAASLVESDQGAHPLAVSGRERPAPSPFVAGTVDAGVPPGSVPSSLCLTPREMEVAALAGEGLSNRDIGARLGISHRTVENQLSHAYAKLGIGGRSELPGRLHAEAMSGSRPL